MRKITTVLDHILFWATAVSAMAFFAVVLASIVVRAMASGQFHSSVELSRLFFVWSCFLAAALGYRRRGHVAFTLLFDRLSQVVQRRVTLLTYVILLAFLVVVFYQAVLICRLLWPTVLPILGISQAWLYVPVPVMCLLGIAYTLEFIVELPRPGDLEGQA